MIWFLLPLCLFVGLFVGRVIGVIGERKSWLIRAYSRDRYASNTPHHANGQFYYIIPENIFCEDFQRKPPATPSE